MATSAVVSSDPLTLSDEALGMVSKPDVPTATAGHAVGRVNTPAHVARWMASEAVRVLTKNRRIAQKVKDGYEAASTLTIVEPAAGSGVIIAALVEAMRNQEAPLRSIWAIDTDPEVKIAAGHRIRLASGKTPTRWLRRQYHIGDALLDSNLLPRKPIDLIIGNPPYLGVRHARRLPSYGSWRRRFGVGEDLYAYFVRWAMQTVRPGGHVLLLVPDGWLSLSSYEDLRCELLRGRLRTVVRLPADTFDRHVFSCFFHWQKTRPRSAYVNYVDARSPHMCSRPAIYKVKQSIFESAPGRIIFVPTPKARDLSRRLSLLAECPCESSRGKPKRGRRSFESQGSRVVPLVEIARITDAGIHSRNCRRSLFYSKQSKAGLRRLLQGRQIEPFAVHWDSPKAQYRWVDIHYEPKSGRLGRRSNGRPSVRREYWDWQGDPAIHRMPERILIRQTGDRIIAARCIQNRIHHYTDNTLFTATLTETARTAGVTYAYLLAYFNAAIVSDFYRFLSGEQGRAQAQIKIKLLRRLPFVLPHPAAIRRVETHVKHIEAAAESGSANEIDQTKIDRHFARLFTSDANGMLAK